MLHDTEDILGLRSARRLVEHIRNRAAYGLARPEEARLVLEEIHEAAERARPLVAAGLQSLVSSESRRIELDEAFERARADRLAEAGFGPYSCLAPRSSGPVPNDEPAGDDDMPEKLASAAIDAAITGEDDAYSLADALLQHVEMPGVKAC